MVDVLVVGGLVVATLNRARVDGMEGIVAHSEVTEVTRFSCPLSRSDKSNAWKQRRLLPYEHDEIPTQVCPLFVMPSRVWQGSSTGLDRA